MPRFRISQTVMTVAAQAAVPSTNTTRTGQCGMSFHSITAKIARPVVPMAAPAESTARHLSSAYFSSHARALFFSL
ncbi:MAG TPA: hypothetical protein VG759_26030 [Candidatus Angelobacter sp.]|nr:hypothetical protein [Candidatus Angelobacter sp.]